MASHTNYFMVAVFIVGMMLFITSMIMAGELDKNSCGTPKARKLNRGIMVMGVILFTCALAYMTCHYRCKCDADDREGTIFMFAAAAIGIVVFVLSVMLRTELGDNCAQTKKWTLMLMALSGGVGLGALGLIGYKAYSGVGKGASKPKVDSAAVAASNEAAAAKAEQARLKQEVADAKEKVLAAREDENEQAIARAIEEQKEAQAALKEAKHARRSGLSSGGSNTDDSPASYSVPDSGPFSTAASFGTSGSMSRAHPSFGAGFRENRFTGLKGG